MVETPEDELRINFLLNACISSENVPEKIKNHFVSTYRILAALRNIPLPAKFTSKLKSCQYCLSNWNDFNRRVKILQKKQPRAAMRRILKKIERRKKLSYVEKKLAMRVHSGNTMEIRCLICQKKTKIPVNKAKEVLPAFAEISSKKKKKKPKKKILTVTIPDTPTLPPPQFSQEPTIDISDDLFVMDTTGDSSNFHKVLKKPLNCGDFIPLNASTPVVKKGKPKIGNTLALNPLNKSKVPQKKRISSLKKLLDEDKLRTPKTVNTLKAFLSNL